MTATLKDIADASGFSIRTIRRVINNDTNVLPEKRDIILKLVRELDYVSNVNARNLRTQSSNFIGVIGFPVGSDGEIFAKKSYDLQKRLESKGLYPIMAAVPETSEDAERLVKDWSGMIRNIVIYAGVNDQVAEVLIRTRRNLIWIDQGREFPGSNIRINRAAGVADAVKYLLSCDRTRILHCGNLESRRKGFELAFSRLKKKPEYHQMFLGSSFDSVYSNAAKLMKNRYDAILFDADRMAFGFLKYAAESGISVPDDIAAVGFDDDTASRYTSPSLSSVAHPFEEINSHIVRLLEEPSRKERNIELKALFVKRESVDARPSK